MKTCTLIACMTPKRVIGKAGKLAWPTIREDLRYFRSQTMGRTVVMGRKTFESLPGPLYGRRMVVVKHNLYPLERALRENHAPIVIGGGEIYRAALPYATHIDLTVLNENFEGDTFFPELDENWEIMGVTAVEYGVRVRYERISNE